MAKLSAEQRALNAIVKFEASGRPVSSVTINGKELRFEFLDEQQPANTLDRKEFNFGKAKKNNLPKYVSKTSCVIYFERRGEPSIKLNVKIQMNQNFIWSTHCIYLASHNKK